MLGCEGVAASCYWSVFSDMIRNDDFVFNGRTKRPPEDKVNALLSFGYTLLTNDIAGCLRSVGFDSQCGYLHSLRSGRDSLACDVVEELRAPIVDRFVLRLINRKEINSDAFTKNGREVVLNDDGRRVVYAHLSENLVKEGDRVTQDTLIGKTGCSGGSRVPHLHVEIRKENTEETGLEYTINPLDVLPEFDFNSLKEEFKLEPYAHLWNIMNSDKPWGFTKNDIVYSEDPDYIK